MVVPSLVHGRQRRVARQTEDVVAVEPAQEIEHFGCAVVQNVCYFCAGAVAAAVVFTDIETLP